MTTCRSLLLAAVVLAAMCAACATASASRGITFSATRIGYGGNVTLGDGFAICNNLLVLKLLVNPYLKRADQPQAEVESGILNNCSGGMGVTSGTFLAGTSVRYTSFSGTLPGFDGIQQTLARAGISISTPFGVSCLYGGDLTGMRTNVTAGPARSITFTGSSLPRVSGGALCPASLRIAGTLTVLGTAPTLTLTN